MLGSGLGTEGRRQMKTESWEMNETGSWPQGAYLRRGRPWEEGHRHSTRFLCWAKHCYALLSSSNFTVPTRVFYELVLTSFTTFIWVETAISSHFYSTFLGWTQAFEKTPSLFWISLSLSYCKGLYASYLDPRHFSVWDRSHDSSNFFWFWYPITLLEGNMCFLFLWQIFWLKST